MGHWKITAADRDAQGRIITDVLGHRSLAELLPPPVAPAEQPEPREESPAAPPATPAPSPRARALGAALALGAVGVLVLSILTSHEAPVAAPVQRAQSTATRPPARPSPTAPTTRYIVAYWAPGGEAVPEPIAERDAYHFTGRQGSDWAQVRLPGGGLVWVRLVEVQIDQADLETLARVPDLTPPTPAPAPVYIPPPAVAQPAQQEEAPAPTALTVPAMRFPEDAPEALPTPRHIGEKPVSKPPPGTRAYGRVGPLQPPSAVDQPLFGSEPTEAPAPARGMP